MCVCMDPSSGVTQSGSTARISSLPLIRCDDVLPRVNSAKRADDARAHPAMSRGVSRVQLPVHYELPTVQGRVWLPAYPHDSRHHIAPLIGCDAVAGPSRRIDAAVLFHPHQV